MKVSSKKPLNMVSYFGGKWPHLKWLIPHFPVGNFHFIDAMCGAANVALNVNYPLITVNDLNNEIINLFYVLRDSHEEFVRQLYFTPFSSAELEKCISDPLPADPIERARQYYVKCQQGYGANGSQNNHKGTGFEFKVEKTAYYRVDNWNKRIAKLPEIIDRLRHFQIMNKDIFYVLDRMDRKDNIIYIDPPYVLSTRRAKKRYTHECEDDFHEKLCNRLLDIKDAFVALSGYDNEIYRDILSEWHLSIGPYNQATVSKKSARECLWTNYQPTFYKSSLF
jgi:DNA adenine methylase